MKTNKYIIFAFISCSLLSHDATSAAVEAVCTPEQSSVSCNKCFTSDQGAYLGNERAGMGQIWNAGTNADEIYIEENKDPIHLITRYTDGAISESTVNPKFAWSGTMYTHPVHGIYIYSPPNTETKILDAKENYFVRFVNLTPAVQANGRTKSLYEFHYSINYWESGDYKAIRNLKICMAYFPAYCGDGVVSHDEICDPADGAKKNWGVKGCGTSCKPN